MRFWKLAVTIVLGLWAPAMAQEQLTIDGSCVYSGDELSGDIYGFESDADAQAATKRIMDQTGLVQNFVISAANVPNAAAVIQGERRAILYNQEFMMRVKDTTNTDWAAISIMAHEVGHHLQGHTIQRGGSRPPSELEADRYSGFVLFKMGATLNQATAAMTALGSDVGSATHPPKSARLAAITNGWRAAGDLARSGQPATNSETTGQRPTIQQTGTTQSTTQQPVGGVQYISRVVFPSDPSTYMVTNANDIVAIFSNGSSALVGRKVPPTLPNFAWMYQTAYVTYGVTMDGRVFNALPNGQLIQIGFVTNP